MVLMTRSVTLSRLILMSAAIFIDSVSGGVVPDTEQYVLSLANGAWAESVVCVNGGLFVQRSLSRPEVLF